MKIGVFGDLHYSKDRNFASRYYSLSLIKLEKLIGIFNSRDVDFCVSLGDTIDSVSVAQTDIRNISDILECLNSLNSPLHICIGNHDLKAFDKQTFLDCISNVSKPYYSFIKEGTLFIILDANNNKYTQYKYGNFDWETAYLDKKQQKWLEKELEITVAQKVFVFVHQNLDDRLIDGSPDPHVIKKAGKVRRILEGSGRKITVLQSHCHYGYDSTINDIRYLTLRAVVESDDTENIPYAVISIDDVTGRETISLSY